MLPRGAIALIFAAAVVAVGTAAPALENGETAEDSAIFISSADEDAILQSHQHQRYTRDVWSDFWCWVTGCNNNNNNNNNGQNNGNQGSQNVNTESGDQPQLTTAGKNAKGGFDQAIQALKDANQADLANALGPYRQYFVNHALPTDSQTRTSFQAVMTRVKALDSATTTNRNSPVTQKRLSRALKNLLKKYKDMGGTV